MRFWLNVQHKIYNGIECLFQHVSADMLYNVIVFSETIPADECPSNGNVMIMMWMGWLNRVACSYITLRGLYTWCNVNRRRNWSCRFKFLNMFPSWALKWRLFPIALDKKYPLLRGVCLTRKTVVRVTYLRLPFLQLMDLPNLMNLMKGYLPISDWMGGKYH